MAGVCRGERSGGGAGVVECDAGIEWRFERSASDQCGRDSRGYLLHRRLSVAAERSADGILGGADEFSGNPGASADYAGIGNSGAAGIDAVCKFSTGGESERQRGGAFGRDGDGDRDQEFFYSTECADACGYGRCDEQGLCGCGGRKCGGGELFAHGRRSDDWATDAECKSDGPAAGCAEAIC